MHLSAKAYNLKKHLKFFTKTVKSDAIGYYVSQLKSYLHVKKGIYHASNFNNKWDSQ